MIPLTAMPAADGVGALRERQLAGQPDDSLHALSHEPRHGTGRRRGYVTAGYVTAGTGPPQRETSLGVVSTRTYIVLAGLTGLVILAAFAVQMVRT